MSVRDAAMNALRLKAEQLKKGLPDVLRELIEARASGAISSVGSKEFIDAYGARINQLQSFGVEQFTWEIAHDPWFRREREAFWSQMIFSEVYDFAEYCKTAYVEAVKDKVLLSRPEVVARVHAGIDERKSDAVQSLFSRLELKDAEVKSSQLKRGLSWAARGLWSGAGAIAGFLWHKYMG